MARPDAPFTITPQILLSAYSIGLFPMAESAEDEQLFWVEPEKRAIFPLDSFIVSRSLAKTVRAEVFDVRTDYDFEAVIDACAAPAPGREKTWINREIKRLYSELFELGYAHTVECWLGSRLVGGLYGVALGAAFFGESMFHTERDASKVALTHLVARLRAGGFSLLDTQFMTKHLASLGAAEVARDVYRGMLTRAIEAEADFMVWQKGARISGTQVLAALRPD